MFKWISRIMLGISGLLETSAGILFLIAPEKTFYQLLKIVAPTGGSVLLAPRMYGLAALCIGLLSFLLLPRKNEPEFLSAGFFILGIFHCGMVLVQLLDNPNWFYVSHLHLILGVSLFILYFYKLSHKNALVM